MNNEINYVSPFKQFVITIGNLPTAYLESMSYYEAITFLVNYLSNNVIPALNNNGLVVEELQAKFTELKNYVDNYFDNLDVQEEINTKLDEMAESGELTDIIAQYLGLAGMITFNNVAEMKLAENLVNGSKCCTLGFYNPNDGGMSFYKIRNITNDDVIDEMSIIALHDNNLIAELLINDIVNVKQFGAYGDGIHDDTVSINNAILKGNTITINNGTYLITPSNEMTPENDNDITKGINVPSNKIINFEKNALLKCITNNYYYYRVLRINNSSNVVINNGKIQGDKTTHTGSMDSEYGHCISILSSHNVTINNMELYDGMGDGIVIIGLNQSELPENNSTNVSINNCLIHDCRRQGISLIGAYNTKIENCEIYDIGGINPQSCIDIEANNENNPVEKVFIDNCNLHDSVNFEVIVALGKDVLINNSTIDKIQINENNPNINISNCIIEQIYCENNLLTIVNNCITNIINLGKDNSKIIVNNTTINKQIYGAFNDTLNQEIICNKCIINNINNNVSWTFLGGNLTKLEFNDCIINTDTNLSGRLALKTTIKNTKINLTTPSKNGIDSKELIFKDNIISGQKLYYLFTPKNFEKNSFIINNLFETKPDWIMRSSENMTQKIFYGNNSSNELITNIFGGTGSLPNLITYNNNPNA